MANRRRLLLAGGYNENIVSYGCEDTELATRLQKLGARVTWLDGYSAYHVAHRRGGDSRYNNFHSANLAEWNKVRAMDRATLEAYVRNGFRALALDSGRSLTITNTAEEFSLKISTPAKTALDDVAFVVPAPPATAAARAWLERFFDELDASYDNFETYLVEAGGYALQSSAHRDHVLYVHAASSAESDCIRPVVEQTSARSCACARRSATPRRRSCSLRSTKSAARPSASPLCLRARRKASAAPGRKGRRRRPQILAGERRRLVFARATYLAAAPARRRPARHRRLARAPRRRRPSARERP
jgi:hypothetical protein